MSKLKHSLNLHSSNVYIFRVFESLQDLVSRYATIAISAMYAEALLCFLYWLLDANFLTYVFILFMLIAYFGESSIFFVCELISSKV